MEIRLYEDWMKPQVANLFNMQYGVKKEDFENLFGNFYEFSFQKDKSVRIVSIEDDIVTGFISFFYWPYKYKGKTYNSYQCGNCLIHPNYRGKGVFQKLLTYFNDRWIESKVDFLMAFPVNASVGSFKRNNWTNLFNLQWYIRILNPISIFLPINYRKLKEYFPNRNIYNSFNSYDDYLKVINNEEFVGWRNTFYDKEKYFTFYFTKGNNEISIKLKINIRKKVFKELIIGDIISSTNESEFISDAFSDLIKKLNKIKFVTFLSIAINEHCKFNLCKLLVKQKFKRLDKQINFVVKPIIENKFIMESDKWVVYRGDLDTW